MTASGSSHGIPLDLDPDHFDIQYGTEEDGDGPNLPPEEPSLSPGEWMRQNLFSSIGNTNIMRHLAYHLPSYPTAKKDHDPT